MPDLDYLDSFYKTRDDGPVYLVYLHREQDSLQHDKGLREVLKMSSSTLPREIAEKPNPEMTCTQCGGHVVNYDPDSAAYQEYYGHPLPAICDSCLNEIFTLVTRYGRRS